jgi:hypothetical protein
MTNLPASSVSAPDPTQRPPRSLRCRLGGFAILPRLLDKWRAEIAGTIGGYHFNCPLDQQFLRFTGIDASELRTEIARGRTDSEMLAWVQENMRKELTPWEIESWSAFQDRRMPASDADTSAFYAGLLGGISKHRADVNTWADLLDLDDHVSFGGSA